MKKFSVVFLFFQKIWAKNVWLSL